MNEITAVLITKNEAKVIERCIRSVKGFDEVVVLDTGSTDKTVEIARRAGAKVVETNARPLFNFSVARNLALSQVRTPWALSIDADEVLRGGSLGKIFAGIRDPKGVSAFTVTFINQDPLNPSRTFTTQKVKIFRVDTWSWRYRVHEQLFTTVEGARIGQLAEVSIEHLPTPDKKARRAQNVELLLLCVKENPEYIRAFRHLGQELMLMEKWDDAIPYLNHYVEKTEESSEQKSAVMTRLAMCLINKGGHYDDALRWLDLAATTNPAAREPLFWAGRYVSTLAQTVDQVNRAIDYFSRALAIKDDGSSFKTTDFPEAWDDGLIKRHIAACQRGLVQLGANTGK